MPLYYKDNNTWKEFATNPYPVGTLVMNQDNDTSPASLVGGTWSKYSNELTTSIVIEEPSLVTDASCEMDYSSGLIKVYMTFNWYAYLPNQRTITFLSNLPAPKEAINNAGTITINNLGNEYDFAVAVSASGEAYMTISVSSDFRIASRNTTLSYTPNSYDPLAQFYTYKRTA